MQPEPAMPTYSISLRPPARLALPLLLLTATFTHGAGPGYELRLPTDPPPPSTIETKQKLQEERQKRAKAEQETRESAARAQASEDGLYQLQSVPKPKPDVVKKDIKPNPDMEKRLRQKEARRAKAEKEAPIAEPAVPPSAVVASRPALGTTLSKDCDVCPELVALPPGSYKRGSPANEKGRGSDEGPVREVRIPYSLAVGKYEVTFAEWDACVADGGCKHNPVDDKGRGRKPVVRVSWEVITGQYIPWLNRKAGYKENDLHRYRLLTEAEWEYAARGIVTAGEPHPPFSQVPGGRFGDGSCIHTDDANYGVIYLYSVEGCSGAERRGVTPPYTAAVGSYKPNRFGLYDMAGNVSEWVQDCWAKDYQQAPTDGTAAAEEQGCWRVLRGGALDDTEEKMRAASRYRGAPDNAQFNRGFRLTRTLP